MLRICLCLTILGTTVVHADDWPQWMGLKRDNVWRETGLVDTLPKDPKIVWRAPIAGGYSGPAVAAGKVYVTDYETNDDVKVGNFERKASTGTERILCLDEKTGKEIWSVPHPETYTISYPAGPRSTPVVENGKVYAQLAEGQLICLDANSGKKVWEKNLKQVYNTKVALWGYSSQPLIDGNKLIVIAGGDGSHCVALNKENGDEIWRTGTATEQGYSPPLIIQQAGVRQLVLCSPDAIYAVGLHRSPTRPRVFLPRGRPGGPVSTPPPSMLNGAHTWMGVSFSLRRAASNACGVRGSRAALFVLVARVR